MTDRTLFHNARFLSMDPSDREYGWVMVQDGRFEAMGEQGHGTEHLTEGDDVVDLRGAVVLPGFVEAHGHPTTEMGILSPQTLDLRASTCGSAREVMEVLSDAVAAAGPSDWVVAFGWDPLLLPDLPEMSGELLTELSPTVPLSVLHQSIHVSWANRAALDRLGLTAQTPDPPGSSYERHLDGTPTGKALEIPATLVLMGESAQPSPEQFDDYLANRLWHMARRGVTTTGDLAFDPAHEQHMVDHFAERGGPVRVRSYEVTGARAPVDPVPTDSTLYRQVGVKMWKDGSPWVGNIETSFGYRESQATRALGLHAGHHGCSNYSHEQLREICEAYYPKGWQIACHVHGDIAVDDVLDVFEQIDREHPRSGYPKFRIEHAGAMTESQVRRAHTLGVSISYFAAHIYYYGEVLRDFFGERADSWVAAGFASKCGMPFSLHNDPPVTAEDPLLNIRTAVTRLTRAGRVMGPEHAVSVREALRAQTIYAAQQLLSDHEVGSIETGKLADMVVLEDDPLTVAPERINDIAVLGTWLGGQRAFDASSTRH
ncbi:amidohydrolase [Kocuria marina]|uniref:amidohydrolase n=1 Tax=Kocuria marina TaxID=223184 RepID=UPI003F206DC1